ncbi:hypothetical protein PFICI_07922 [Pestalotiopsis fici W106-1]|uniref:Heterokaryon incompatibility domain-containing protein n=1 Tax=Pestalotiopsis fici (strain W106-1 / CGMCC3.15140) TaxID=1229662 RepID=W3X2M4_PESFW|nr:uncharacterized protein PFICI_07922 [Pestalotiopsis fici W106-1]ETS80393.1 hypothetical protein PFICI_07922 [Pestalotiopsis fici W106-1]
MVQYHPLTPSRSEIRVLTLLGGKPEDDVKCTLGIVSLDEKPEFAALSYVWGDASIKKPITVDGETFEVTINLNDALRALRQRRESRTLWVDAICINQTDTEEKNTQIPLMGRLYSEASSVVVWMGPLSRNMELAISWAQTYVAKTYNQASTYWLKLDAKAKFSKTAKREKDWATLGALEGFWEVMSLSYWSRMWTFQEFRLPPQEPICQCGHMTFYASSMLGQAEEALVTAGQEALFKFGALAKTWSGRPLTDEEGQMADDFIAANKRIKAKSNFARQNSIVSLTNARSDWRTYESPLLYLLMATAERQCFDAHDKMYALYGLVPAAQEAIPVDYKMPLRDLAVETAAFLIKHERGALIWSSFGLRDGRLSGAPEFPSWMPDFTDAERISPRVHRAKERVAECLCRWDEAPAAEIVDDLTTVRLWARKLGPIQVIHRFEGGHDGMLKQVRRLVQQSSNDLLQQHPKLSIRKPENLGARMASMCFNHGGRRFDFDVDSLLEALRYDDPPDLPADNTITQCWYMIESVSKLLAGKALFLVENRSFGIGLGDMQDGDVLVIPPQVRHPLVLTKNSSDGYLRMVGTAIVDGVMNSTFLDDELVKSIENQALEEFLIH